MIECKGVNVHIKSWCNTPEETAIQQAKAASALPFIHKHVALMPDTHCGYGVPIGSVIACDKAIIPGAVGVDIGCGVACMETSLTRDMFSTELLKDILSSIRDLIPVGRMHREQAIDWYKSYKNFLFSDLLDFVSAAPVGMLEKIQALVENESVYQIGTLGGGNHFMEIQEDEEGKIHIMVHTGSRNFGYKIANMFCSLAEEECKETTSKNGLDHFRMDTKMGVAYLKCMKLCMQFALANRAFILDVWEDVLAKKSFEASLPDFSINKKVDVQHNYASLEKHFEKDVWVHRKGAISAKRGEIGIIPGSQGTSSYIVEGLGNIDSFTSCSHGAGRTMSRTKAKKLLNLETEIQNLDNKNIIHSIRTKTDLDEAASAYKDIDMVMEEQKDLVKITKKLTPVAVIKG